MAVLSLSPIGDDVLTTFEAHPPISVVGLGYVGIVSAACFAEMAHRVVGVDIDDRKVEAVRSGAAPLVEDGLDALTARVAASGHLRATNSVREAVETTDVTFVCVGTPSREDGTLDLAALAAVAEALGEAIRDKPDYHLVVVRSTIPVGTTRNLVLPLLEARSGKACGTGFGLCFHPEFLREGVAIADFFHPPKTVVGAFDGRSGDILARLYDALDAPLIVTSIEVAELVKYVDNNWHAVKVAFANEIGKICQSVGVDSHDVMNIFVQDTKLNLSAYYMKPGFAFGGSCLPKDVRAMQKLAQFHGVRVPLIDSLTASNDAQIEHALALIEGMGGHRIGFLGVTFKAGTDDLRESPYVELMGRLLRRGHEVRAYDENVSAAGRELALCHAKTASAQTREVLAGLPDLLQGTAAACADWADIVLVCHRTETFASLVHDRAAGKKVLDLVRVGDAPRGADGYAGICW